jgi:hypothetical protein
MAEVEEMLRPPISPVEWSHIGGYASRLIDAIKETDHVQQHIGSVAFEMMLHLPVAQRPGVLAYLNRAVREASN